MSNKRVFAVQSLFSRSPNLIMLGLIWVIVFILMSLLNPDHFLTVENLRSIGFQLPELGILSLAMMITLLSGGIDLSIIASANLSGIVAGFILTRFAIPDKIGLAIILAVLAGLMTSLVIGLINGFIIAFIEVPPILATLGTMMLVEGLSIVTTKGYVIAGFPEEIQFIGNGSVLGVPVPLIIFVICAIFMSVVLNKTPFGLSIYMFGSNGIATLFAGVNTKSLLVKTYVTSGFLCGVAALIMLARFNSASAGYSSSYLLITILVSVLGGINPYGGFGKVSGLVLALLILQMIASGINIFGISSYVGLAIWGMLLILVMGLRSVKNN